MTEQKSGDPVPFSEYNPTNWGEARIIIGPDIPVPKHENMQPGQLFVWETVSNKPVKTVISNLIHRDFPDTYCQIQMSFEGKNIHTFFFHSGLRENHMPEEFVDATYMGTIAPWVLERYEEQKGAAAASLN